MRPMRLPVATAVFSLSFFALAGCHNEPGAASGGVGASAGGMKHHENFLMLQTRLLIRSL